MSAASSVLRFNRRVLQQVVAGLKVVGKFPHKINGSRRTVEKEMSE